MCSRFSKPWRYIPSSGIVRPLDSVSSTFLSYCQIVLQKGCVNSHSHYQCIIVSFSLHALHTFKCLSILWTWKEILLYLSISLILMRQHFQVYLSLGLALTLIIYSNPFLVNSPFKYYIIGIPYKFRILIIISSNRLWCMVSI